MIATNHPFIVALGELDAEYPDGDAPDEAYPDLTNFMVLVKDKGIKTLGDIPDGIEYTEGPLQGMVVNSIESLSDEENDLIRQGFPGVNPEKVILLEKGRKPAGPGKKFGMIGGGVLLVLLGLGWFIAGFRKSS